MQLGAFYPFSRNHNAGYFSLPFHLFLFFLSLFSSSLFINDSSSTTPQEPYAFEEPYRSIMISAFLQKLSLSPFYYTLLYQASTVGTLVINPLFYVFPQVNCEAIDVCQQNLCKIYHNTQRIFFCMFFFNMVSNPLQDNNAQQQDIEFMVGTALLVSPVVAEGMNTTRAYFPMVPFFSFCNSPRNAHNQKI
jgi:alpha-glucosidase (family GH31 glycosyl hydrolase)